MKFLILFLIVINVNTLNAQLNPEGKTFIAETSSTCKMMQDGGCTINNYCVLKFNKETVVVSHFIKAVCSPKSREKNYNQNREEENKIYNWSIHNDTLEIKGFEDYGTFKISGEKLIAKKEINGNFKILEFLEEKKKR